MASTCISNSTSNIFYCDTIEYDSGPHHHVLDSCSLCKTPITKNSDIFMYRGDTPFCSEECRQQQMEIDREKEYFRRSNTTAKRSSSSTGKNKGRRELRQMQEDQEVY